MAEGAEPPISFETFADQAARGRIADCEAFLSEVRAYWGPESLEFLQMRAHLLHRQSEFPEALAVCEAITHHFPAYANHRYIFADVCAHLGRPEPVLKALATFTPGQPRPASRLQSLEVFQALGLDDQALALREDLDLTDTFDLLAQMSQSQTRMRRDGIISGLAGYGRAWTDPRAKALIHNEPALLDSPRQWRPAEGLPKTLLIFRRGGVGDTIQWIRYLPALRAAGVDARLAENDDPIPGLNLIDLEGPAARAWATQRLSDLTAGAAAAETQIADPFELFTALYPSLGYGDPPGPYLRPTPDSVTADLLAQIKTAAAGRPTLGLFWSANESHHTFAHKSLTLPQVEPLLARGDIHWVIFQRGLQRDAWVARPESALTTVLPPNLTFSQTGALAQGLDAVVTVDSALAHLSGALGRPTFLLASAAADWRWGAIPRATPWYGSMDVVRQPGLGDWDGAVGVLGGRLGKWGAG